MQRAPSFNPAAGPQWPRVLNHGRTWYLLPGTDPAVYGLEVDDEDHPVTGVPVPMVKVTVRSTTTGWGTNKPYFTVWLEADRDSDPQDACLYMKYETTNQ